MKFVKPVSKEKEALQDQIELLSERSKDKDCSAKELAELSDKMVSIYLALNLGR